MRYHHFLFLGASWAQTMCHVDFGMTLFDIVWHILPRLLFGWVCEGSEICIHLALTSVYYGTSLINTNQTHQIVKKVPFLNLHSNQAPTPPPATICMASGAERVKSIAAVAGDYKPGSLGWESSILTLLTSTDENNCPICCRQALLFRSTNRPLLTTGYALRSFMFADEAKKSTRKKKAKKPWNRPRWQQD